MTRYRIVFLLPAALLTIACSDETTSPDMGAPHTVSAARAPTLPTVSLVVTVSSADQAGNPYGIQPDGQGVYTNGSQNVQAVLDQSGTFAFNTNTFAKKTAIRWVSYNFNTPVDSTNTYRPSPSNTRNFHFSTGPSAYSPFTPIQNLGANGNPTSECIYMGNGISNSITSWRVSFHKGQEDLSDGPTAYAVVTRTSVSPAVWTITPAGSCSPASNVASLRSGDGAVLHGYYYIPFFLTLTAK